MDCSPAECGKQGTGPAVSRRKGRPRSYHASVVGSSLAAAGPCEAEADAPGVAAAEVAEADCAAAEVADAEVADADIADAE